MPSCGSGVLLPISDMRQEAPCMKMYSMSATDTKAVVMTLWENKSPVHTPCADAGACFITALTPACKRLSVALY